MIYIKMAFWLIQMQTHITFIQRVAWYYENEIAHHSLANKAISNDNKYNNNIYMDVSGSLSPSLPSFVVDIA